jgi:DNA repair photolyase
MICDPDEHMMLGCTFRNWMGIMQRKVYTTPLGITSQFTFCGLPLRLDSYTGCAFQCTYCFARVRGGNSFEGKVRPADYKKIEGIFSSALDSKSHNVGMIAQFIRHRVPVHFGGMSDPFQPAELRYRITEKILRLLSKYDYPTVISTKGDLILSEPYITLLREMKHIVVQFSFSSSLDNMSTVFEPFSAPPSKLMKSMENLANLGINVTCRWQPFIPGVSESPEEFVSRMASTGCKHIGFEHLKIPVERGHSLSNKLIKGVNRDIYKEYQELGAYLDGREYVLPAKEKLPLVLETASVAQKYQLTFGAADNDLQYLSTADCCCSGIDQFPGFENWYKYQIGYAVRKCREKDISFESIEAEWHPIGSIDRHLNSHSRLSKSGYSSGAITDHILAKWNNPEAASSPASFYGVTPTDKTTLKGNRIYQWDPDIKL